MTPDTPEQTLPTLPDTKPQAPVFGEAPKGKKPKSRSPSATFLGPNASPSVANSGFKSLVGQ